MTDNSHNNAPNPETRSPIRPINPDQPTAPTAEPEPISSLETDDLTEAEDNPEIALENLRRKMEHVAGEFSAGRLNRAQFNAIYGRYNEQRMIIERLMERNPETQAWQQVAASGHTSFLMAHFQARVQYFAVYRADAPVLLTMSGREQPNIDQIEPILNSIIQMPQRPQSGLARKAMGKGRWLVLALGSYTVTMVMFALEPSTAQLNHVRDLHADFERANRRALERGTQSFERMVFPQRALVE